MMRQASRFIAHFRIRPDAVPSMDRCSMRSFHTCISYEIVDSRLDRRWYLCAPGPDYIELRLADRINVGDSFRAIR